jgi:hypothetical protein
MKAATIHTLRLNAIQEPYERIIRVYNCQGEVVERRPLTIELEDVPMFPFFVLIRKMDAELAKNSHCVVKFVYSEHSRDPQTLDISITIEKKPYWFIQTRRIGRLLQCY